MDSSQELLFVEQNPIAFQTTTILTSLSLGLTINFRKYPYKSFPFLLLLTQPPSVVLFLEELLGLLKDDH